MTDMPKTLRPIILSGLALAFAPQAAHAHLGHIGEIAGHSHWLGYGALAAAAAALALLPKKKKQENGEQAEEEVVQEDGEGQEEAA